MPTYRTTARNQFRSPSGAVGEAPDGPGSMATMLDDVDNYLGVGGAEYNSTSLNAVPAGRRFIGKLVYFQPTDIVYRYCGTGGTALGSGSGANWQAWEKPAASFTPTYSTGLTGTTVSQSSGLWGISAGLLWVSTYTQYSAAPNIPGGIDLQLTLPSLAVAAMGEGSGTYTKGGSTANNNQVDLICYPVGTPFAATTTLRFRSRWVDVAGAVVKQNVGMAGVTGAVNDWISLNFRGPSGMTYTG